MQEAEKKHEGEARKLVYDPKRGAFVPSKKKGKTLQSKLTVTIVITFSSQHPQQVLVKDKKVNPILIQMIPVAVVVIAMTVIPIVIWKHQT
jgi:cytoskeletal protein RodZ